MAGRIAALSVVIHRAVDRVCRVLLESGSAQVAEVTVLQFGGIVADRTGVATALGMAAMLAGGEAVVLCRVVFMAGPALGFDIDRACRPVRSPLAAMADDARASAIHIVGSRTGLCVPLG